MVHLRKKKLKSGRLSLFLDYYTERGRIKEYLNVVLVKGEKENNTEKLRIAETLRAQKELDLINDDHSMVNGIFKRKSFHEYFETQSLSIKTKDYRLVIAAQKKFLEFHPAPLRFMDLTEQLFIDFKNYLDKKLHGETPANYFKKTKLILNKAVREGYLKQSPAKNVKNSNKAQFQLRKQVLFPDEINKLYSADCGNSEVKKAFLFATQTGLRLCDVRSLKWNQVHRNPDYIKVEQSKTNDMVVVPLNSNAVELLGVPGDERNNVFHLNITSNAVNKNLKRWAENAGLKKHITFHCARHSFITNILSATGNLKIASTLAGHTTTRNTEKYTHIADKMKVDAVNLLVNLSNHQQED